MKSIALNVSKAYEETILNTEANDKDLGFFIGRCPAMQKAYNLIRQAGPSSANVFVVGETGTGKELVARAIHACSGRSGPFVPINCAAIPADMLESQLFGYVRGAFTGAYKDQVGKFELANQGTLFLDEITEMPVSLQAKLLRVLQESSIDPLGSTQNIEVDVRIITSTNRDPLRAVRTGHLRQDLYYRIDVVHIQLPPLRERQEDVLLLARHFIKKYSQDNKHSFQLTDEMARTLMSYSWPGNVRELENMMERAVVLDQDIEIGFPQLNPEDNGRRASDVSLEPHGRRASDMSTENYGRRSTDSNLELAGRRLSDVGLDSDGRRVSDANLTGKGRRLSDDLIDFAIGDEVMDLDIHTARLETRLLKKALTIAGGNKALAARLLKISERSFRYKLDKYGLSNKAEPKNST